MYHFNMYFVQELKLDFRIYHVTEFLLQQLQDCLKTCPGRQQEKKHTYMHTELTLDTYAAAQKGFYEFKETFMFRFLRLCSDHS